MISAFFGLSGRDDAAFAALVTADAVAALGRSVTILRVTLPTEASLPARSCDAPGVKVVERDVAGPEFVGALLAETLPALVGADRDVVLDLPFTSIFQKDVAASVDLPVVTVCPTPIGERAAASMTVSLHRETNAGVRHPWLLACGCGDHQAVANLAFEVAALAIDLGCGEPCRVLPATLPVFRRRDAERVADGGRTARTRRTGLVLLAALRAAAEDPTAAQVDEDVIARHLVPGPKLDDEGDDRGAGDRLRDLADELGAIAQGLKPANGDLSDAPRLEDWSMVTRPVCALSGRVFGHPGIPDGSRITTSDLYASDGRSWARTLSRYYVLAQGARSVSDHATH